MIDWISDHFDHVDREDIDDTSEDYIQSVIKNRGQECGNCGAWRLLKPEFEDARTSIEAGSLRIIEECSDCHDEAFDIYEAAEDGP